VDYLKDHHGLSQKDAETCYRIMRQNLVEFGLVEEASGRQVVLSRATAEEQLGDDDGTTRQIDDTANSSSMPSNGPEELQHTSGVAYVDQLKSGAVQPQIAFNIQIQLPENAEPETYDAIFRNIAIHLLGKDEN
jgi:hypothetical protein